MTQYCPQCTEEESCGKYHVYVIELNEKVRDNYLFQAENPHLDPDDLVPCYYVGMTEHKPECRLKQHIESYTARRLYVRGLAFYPREISCSCFGKAKQLILEPKRKKNHAFGNRIAGRYGKHLTPEIFSYLNPIVGRNNARKLERELANELRYRGNGASIGGEGLFTNRSLEHHEDS